MKEAAAIGLLLRRMYSPLSLYGMIEDHLRKILDCTTKSLREASAVTVT